MIPSAADMRVLFISCCFHDLARFRVLNRINGAFNKLRFLVHCSRTQGDSGGNIARELYCVRSCSGLLNFDAAYR
jgi:hypothetical protein